MLVDMGVKYMDSSVNEWMIKTFYFDNLGYDEIVISTIFKNCQTIEPRCKIIDTERWDLPMRLVTSLVLASSPTNVPLMKRISSPISIFPVFSAGSPSLRPVIWLPLYRRPNVPLYPLVIVTEYLSSEDS